MSIAVYVGAGLDTFPLTAVQDANHFIFIDSRPKTQQPFCPNNLRLFESDFLGNVHTKMVKRGFYPVISQGHSAAQQFVPTPYHMRYETDEGDRTAEYYFNTSFPSDIDKHPGLRQKLQQCTNIIIAGHDPHRSLLEMVPKPFTVSFFEGTYYGREVFDDSGVILELYGKHACNVKEIRHYKKRVHMDMYTHMEELKTL